MDRRGTAHQRGYDSRWSDYSKLYRKHHPLCALCKENGVFKPSSCVDHIKPVTRGQADPLFWDEDNHRALCWSCHSRITAAEDGGYGNKKGKARVRAACGVDGLPIDRNHHWKTEKG